MKQTLSEIEKSPTTPVHDGTFMSKERRPEYYHAVIAKGRPPAPLGKPLTLRRTKSLPALFDLERRNSGSKSLFWFRPYPNRPLLKAKVASPSSPLTPSSTGNKPRRMLKILPHRRVATSVDSCFFPSNLALPTLQEEDKPVLKPGFVLRREDSYNGDVSSAEFDITNESDDDMNSYDDFHNREINEDYDDDEDDEDEDDLDLHGLSLLEERDE